VWQQKLVTCVCDAPKGDGNRAHKVYSAIVAAVKSGALPQPFTKSDFRKTCPSLGQGTYAAFLNKHCKGNPGGNSELFERESPGSFSCLRPFRYNLGKSRSVVMYVTIIR
jgi:hypothetical protein